MSVKRVLVTGAGGYIGRHVVNELLNQGYHVLASDMARERINPDADFVATPIFVPQEALIEKLGSPDAVIHLAWRDGFVHNSSSHMLALSSHVAFLNQLLDAGLNNLSVMGSMHEVGYWEGMVTEHTPCNPLSQYGIAKNALRQSMMLYAEGTQTHFKWLRAFYIYGDDQYGSSIFSKIYKAAMSNQKEFPFTTGKNLYDFISVYDLAKQIVMATMQEEYQGIINVCSGTPVSLADQVESYIQEHHFDIRLKYGAYIDRPYDSPCVWGDASIIRQIKKNCMLKGSKGNAVYKESKETIPNFVSTSKL